MREYPELKEVKFYKWLNSQKEGNSTRVAWDVTSLRNNKVILCTQGKISGLTSIFRCTNPNKDIFYLPGIGSPVQQLEIINCWGISVYERKLF